ncbi:MAG TPA: aminotransferase class III-fold pyridoxal phosphate-dependent enzyme [Gaiellaceae bacterium]|nr:aminotransferase class III-fold pyridoxal phosphate-dependent enzyme [Gaiellaceae bacterium]
MTRFWHPFADMGLVEERGELVLERGEGARLWDEQGRSYIDATGALWYCNVGYGRAEIAEAAAEQIRLIPAYSAYADLATRPAVDLAERLAALSPLDDARVFFCSGGGEAIESASKLARRFFSLTGQPERSVLISRDRSYHGVAGFGTSLAGPDVFREGLTPPVPDVIHVAWDSSDALRDAIENVGAERVAAFFCEPVIGAGGVLAPPAGYLDDVQAICRDAGCLFVVDEVITSFGRCGHWFASERFGIDPDLITFAKGSTSGYLPLGGVIASGRIAEPFWKPGGGVMFRHGYTYSGHAAVAAASHANLDILDRDGLIPRGAELETELTEALAPLGEHELVSEIRSGTGVMGAVQLKDPSLADRASMLSREHGVITRVLYGGALQISPPLVITRDELDEMTAGIGAALDACVTAGVAG